MSSININATPVSPLEITASQLNYWDNRFYPVFKWKTYNVLFNIRKEPWKYFFKIEFIPMSNDVLKLKAYKSTTRISDIIEIITMWRAKLEKHPWLVLNNETEDKTSWLLWNDIVDALQEIDAIDNEINKATDADSQALLAIDYFDKFENLTFLWAATKSDIEIFEKNTEILIWQYEEIKAKIKKENNQINVLRMLDKYIKLWHWWDKYNTWILFEVFDDIIMNIDKKKNKNLSDFVNLARTFSQLANKKILFWWLNIDRLDKIEDMLSRNEEKMFKESQRKEDTIAWVIRDYKKRRANKWFHTSEKAARNWESYEDEELTEILNDLSDICSWQWEQVFNSKLWKDIVNDLAIKYDREPWAIISIFKLAFSWRPFMNDWTNNDMNYTMRILIKRNQLWLDNYWKTNQWFSDRYHEELELWNWKESTLLRNMEILDKM